MNAKHPERAVSRPRGMAAPSPCTVPSAPVDGVQGDRLPLTAAAAGNPGVEVAAPASTPGPDVPAAAEASAPAAVEASRRPARSREGPGGAAGVQPEALSGKAFRDAYKAANSAKAKGQRNQRARPWTKRDPYRKAVPGGRKPPPGGGAA